MSFDNNEHAIAYWEAALNNVQKEINSLEGRRQMILHRFQD